jgi:adenosylhomocysteinase
MSLIISQDEDDGKVERFFREVINDNTNLCCEFIVVIHYVPTFPYFLEALSTVGKIALLIPKGSYRNEDIVNEISAKGYRVLGNREENFGDDEYESYFLNGIFKSRKYLQTNGKLLKLVDATISSNSKFVFIDVGGYYSYSFDAVKEKYGDRFIGIVEATENGHQKYMKSFSKLKENSNMLMENFPILSMARSSLKQTEDYNVGKSIVEAVSSILRKNAHTIIERMNIITVIGFGKIGKSIAEHLRQKNVKRVLVYEIDPIRLMEAVSLGFAIADDKWVFSSSDMIFCATGNQSINNINFKQLKNNVFIASCTSNDDEYNLDIIDKLLETHTTKTIIGHIVQYCDDEKVVNMIHDGNSVNFIYNATNGPFIYSVLVGLIFSAIKLIRKSYDKSNDEGFLIRELDRSSMQGIAKIWLSVFENYH